MLILLMVCMALILKLLALSGSFFRKKYPKTCENEETCSLVGGGVFEFSIGIDFDLTNKQESGDKVPSNFFTFDYN